jgi:hypothetical protein
MTTHCPWLVDYLIFIIALLKSVIASIELKPYRLTNNISHIDHVVNHQNL